MDKNNVVAAMHNVYVSIAEQLKTDHDLACLVEHVKDADKYDWNKMRPRVTYSDWIVCIYEHDNKLYCIDFDQCVVREVDVVDILSYNDHHEPVDANGNVIDDDDLHGYRDSDYCGESDDMNCYIYFELVDNLN